MFGVFVAFLAAYREAFETVLFYQTLLASTTETAAVLRLSALCELCG